MIHIIHGWLHWGLRNKISCFLKLNCLFRGQVTINWPSWVGKKKITLKVAKASEAISNVDNSTYLKKSLNWLEKRMILASGSCRIHSLSIIPQRKAICGASYLKRKQERNRELCYPIKIILMASKEPFQYCYEWKHTYHLSRFIQYPLKIYYVPGTIADVFWNLSVFWNT